MARKFFITGGTGLIGRALVRALLAQREQLDIEQLTLLSRNPERFKAAAPDIASAEGISLVQGDMASDAWPDGEFTDIIHGATDVNDMLAANRFAYAWGIVEGTRRTLELAKRSGCQRYLYLSSGAVYGPGPYPDSGIPEDWPIAPELDAASTAYGQAKRFSEHLCALAADCNSMAVRVARIFSVIGPESPLDGQFALGSFISAAVSSTDDSIRIKGDGIASRSYLHIDDLTRWLTIFHEQAPTRSTLNFGAAREITVRALAETISRLSALKKPVIVERAIADYSGRTRYFPDSNAVRTTLGVSELFSLENSLSLLLEKANFARDNQRT